MTHLINHRLAAPIWAAISTLGATIGAYNGAGKFAAAMCGFAVLAYMIGVRTYFRLKAMLDTQRHITDEQRRLMALGRRARWIMLTVKTRDGGPLYAATLEQILGDVTPAGGDLIWDEPTAAALWYTDPQRLLLEVTPDEPCSGP
jgi:hypothetical protein